MKQKSLIYRSTLSTLSLCFFLISGFSAPALGQKNQLKGPSAPTEIIAAPVKYEQFYDSVEALGTTKANESVVITATTSEKITDINFTDGQEVKKGDLLVTLDKNVEEAELKSAQAQRDERLSAYNRAKNLQQTSALSTATLQERKASLTEIEADIESIKTRINQLMITAPFDGVLGLREVSIGALVKPGDEITTIDDLNQIKVDFDVPSIYLESLKSGLPIIGEVDAFKDKKFTGEIATINTQIDPVTRTVTVRAVLPNPDHLLKPGLLMRITLLKNQRNALLIPEESLVKRGDKNFVYTLENENGRAIAHMQQISIGGRKPGVIEVLSGLKEGQKVITDGIVKINDGAPVTEQTAPKGEEETK